MADLVEETYRGGSTMGAAFGELLRKLLARFDILQVDPMLPEFRELAAPALRTAVEAHPELTAGLLQRNRELARRRLSRPGARGRTDVLRVPARKRQAPDAAAPRAGVRAERPKVFDRRSAGARRFAFAQRPAAAGGAGFHPAHGGLYHAAPPKRPTWRSPKSMYRTVLGRMPVIVPRTGFTILDQHSAKLMDRYRLALPDFFQGEELLRERIAAEAGAAAAQRGHRRDAPRRWTMRSGACAALWPPSTPRWRRLSTAARARSATRSPKSKARPAARPCAASQRAAARQPRSAA